jgi:hypothetical protein
MRALEAAYALHLPDWCIAAGFVRNLIWDKLHGFAQTTPLNDIDLIYFDSHQSSRERDRQIEARLNVSDAGRCWSVKNQARMHLRNHDQPYRSTLDAMRYWIEIETAIGVKLDKEGRLAIVSPFGLDSLFDKKITPNMKRFKPADFSGRVSAKKWLEIWPELTINAMPAKEM